MVLAFTVKIAAAQTVEISSKVASKSVDPTSGLVNHNSGVVESDVLLSWENGFYVQIWNSQVLHGESTSFGNSLEGYVGYANSIAGWDYDLCLGYTSAPELTTLETDDNLYACVQVGHSIEQVAEQLSSVIGSEVSFSGFARFEHYETLFDTDYEGGNLYSVGFESERDLSKAWLSRNSITFTYDDGVYGEENGFLSKLTAGLNYQLSENVAITAEGDLFAELSDFDGTREGLIGKLGLTASF